MAKARRNPAVFIRQRPSIQAALVFDAVHRILYQAPAWISRDALSEETGLSFAAIERVLKELERNGWLERKRRGGTRKHAFNLRINVPVDCVVAGEQVLKRAPARAYERPWTPRSVGAANG